jgi:ABC-type Na+ efflux pump permease subunit
MLQDHDIENVLAHRKKNRSALYMILTLSIIVLIVFYAIGFILGSDAFFSFESFQSQLLLFICCSLLVFIPFLLKPIRITKKTME